MTVVDLLVSASGGGLPKEHNVHFKAEKDKNWVFAACTRRVGRLCEEEAGLLRNGLRYCNLIRASFGYLDNGETKRPTPHQQYLLIVH